MELNVYYVIERASSNDALKRKKKIGHRSFKPHPAGGEVHGDGEPGYPEGEAGFGTGQKEPV